MSIFFMSLWAVSILFMYVHSVLLPMERTRKNQFELLKSLEKMENDPKTPNDFGASVMKGVSIGIVIFYVLFYVLAAIIVNQLFFTLVSAAFIAMSVHSLAKILNLLKTREAIEMKWHVKLHSVVGLIYTMYFINFYYNLNAATDQAPVILGGTVAVIIFVWSKANAKRKRDKKAREETPE